MLQAGFMDVFTMYFDDYDEILDGASDKMDCCEETRARAFLDAARAPVGETVAARCFRLCRFRCLSRSWLFQYLVLYFPLLLFVFLFELWNYF